MAACIFYVVTTKTFYYCFLEAGFSLIAANLPTIRFKSKNGYKPESLLHSTRSILWLRSEKSTNSQPKNVKVATAVLDNDQNMNGNITIAHTNAIRRSKFHDLTPPQPGRLHIWEEMMQSRPMSTRQPIENNAPL
ncbi:uncharacterized protein KY384_008853 [Bacidia gigantensis]|uniref:uncharacterized protein n=1 Tax=Bacidia gigantensis TaxID=2732470 RepID=UPI001D03E6FC|nr:uncharacterized protein KY384_008853 [Bacidia gigantensis]KAG8525209.1 hypothetical protein KY384_008853 [Bacidia gigantensis]